MADGDPGELPGFLSPAGAQSWGREMREKCVWGFPCISSEWCGTMREREAGGGNTVKSAEIETLSEKSRANCK